MVSKTQRKKYEEIERARELERKEIEKVKSEKVKKIKKRQSKMGGPTFWQKYEDPISYVILFLIIGFVLYMNYSGDRRKDHQIPINEDTLI